MKSTDKVAVIGAGPAGLAAAKSLAEVGFTPSVFDRSAEVGGMWVRGRGPAWEGMRTNLSKHTCEFSDLRHPKDTAEFPTVPEMNSYLNSYAQTFGLTDHARLSAEVTYLRQEKDRLLLAYKTPAGADTSESFDAVVVASGYFSSPGASRPSALEHFAGDVVHSSQYRDREAYRGKRVVVIGHGLSGVEIAADVCGSAESVVHLFRRPSWVIPRYLFDKEANRPIPLDLVFYRRKEAPTREVSQEERNRQRNKFFASLSKQNEIGCNDLYIDSNDDRAFPIAISDRYVELVRTGGIIPNLISDLSHCNGKRIGVTAHQEFEADVVILATGYRFELPFLDTSIKEKLEYREDDPLQAAILSNAILPNGVNGLGFVGAYKGPFWGAMELQARYLARVLRGEIPYPSDAEMEVGLAQERAIRNALPRPQFPHPNYVEMCDELAGRVGCLPKLAPEDPLASAVRSGPVVPAHFRLTGVGKDEEQARETITQLNREYFPRAIKP